jgi:hypothetical protein
MINDRGMKKIITLIMCVWMLASCQESREEAMLRLVNEWNGKEIKFPTRSVFTIQGKDTVDLSSRMPISPHQFSLKRKEATKIEN